MNILVKKATIKSSLFLAYEFEQTDVDVKNAIKTTSDAPIHEDLRTAFRALIPHFAFICEEITDEDLVSAAIETPESYLEDPDHSASDVFFKYRVAEFAIKGKGDAEQITIAGSKKLANGKQIYFTTPEMYLDDADYKFKAELQTSIDVLKDEILAYMQGKQAPKTQLEMFEETDEDDNNEDDDI